MTKKIIAAALALLLLCGCGAAPSADPYTVELADELLASGAFEGSDMAPLAAPVIALLYGLDEAAITQCVGYMAANTSVSADELLILILKDEDAAAAAEAACQARVASQIAVCEDYCPAAVPRLNEAIVSRRGNTVLMVVGDPAVLSSLDSLK